MMRSLSEFRFFRSFRIPVESGDDVIFALEKEDIYTGKGEFIRDSKVTDVSVTGLGFKSAHKLELGDSINVSISFKRLRLDLSADIVRSFSSQSNDEEFSYGVEITDEEDLEKMKRFVTQLIASFNQERVKDCLRELAFEEDEKDIVSGFEVLSLMLSLYKDMMSYSEKEGFIDSMLEETTRILNAGRAVVYLINAETNQLEASHTIGIKKNKLRFDYRKGIAGAVFTTGNSLNIDSSHNKIKFYEKIDAKLKVVTKSVICTPVRNKDNKIIGVLEVCNKRNQERFSEEDEKVMQLLSLVFSSFFRGFIPHAERSLIRRFSAPHARDLIWIGKSNHTTDLRKCIMKLKDLSTPILITGERGVGKELYAKILHKEGARGSNEYTKISCVTHGHDEIVKLLTGSEEKKGLLETHSGGSIGFEEIDKMSMKTQKFLMERLANPLKENVDVRLIFTSLLEPQDLFEKGVVGEEFLAYCNQNHVNIQPIRNRKKDIKEMLDYAVAKECKEQGFLEKVFSNDLKEAMINYEWPGNVNELQTAVARLVRYNPNNHVITEVDDEILPILETRTHARISTEIPYVNDSTLTLKERVLLVEREMIYAEIKRHKGNKSQSAISMGISREALRKKLIACEDVYARVQEMNKNKQGKDIDEDTMIFELPKAA